MLKELYDKGPQDAFYVVKVWVKNNNDEKTNLSSIIAIIFSLGQHELSRECCKYISLFIVVRRFGFLSKKFIRFEFVFVLL